MSDSDVMSSTYARRIIHLPDRTDPNDYRRPQEDPSGKLLRVEQFQWPRAVSSAARVVCCSAPVL